MPIAKWKREYREKRHRERFGVPSVPDDFRTVFTLKILLNDITRRHPKQITDGELDVLWRGFRALRYRLRQISPAEEELIRKFEEAKPKEGGGLKRWN